VLFAAPEPGAGPAARTVLDRLADRGLHVVETQSQASLRSTIAPASPECAPPIGAALLSWELFESAGELAAVIDEIQRLSAPPPVVVVSELALEQGVPPGLAGRTAASFWLHADSPHFVADQVEWLVRTYALRSQVLGALAAGAASAAAGGPTTANAAAASTPAAGATAAGPSTAGATAPGANPAGANPAGANPAGTSTAGPTAAGPGAAGTSAVTAPAAGGPAGRHPAGRHAARLRAGH
jgi:hypothetical protein